MMDLEKWAVWHFRATIVNDGVNSGNHDYVFTAGAGNVMVLLGGQILNGDAAGRVATVQLRDTDNAVIRRLIPAVTIAAAGRREFPTSEASADNASASDGSPLVVSGTEDLLASLASLAVNENSEVAVQFLISGGIPTVVLTSPTGAVETETENRVV